MNEMYGKRDHLTTQLEDVIPGTKTYTAMKSLIEEYSKSIQLKETSMSGPIGLMLADDAPADGADDNSGSDAAADNGSTDAPTDGSSDSNSGASTGDDSGSSAAGGDSNTESDNSGSSNATPDPATPPKNSGGSDSTLGGGDDAPPPKGNTVMIVGIIAVVAIGVTLGMFLGKKGCFAKKGELEGEGGEKDDLYVKFLNAELKA